MDIEKKDFMPKMHINNKRIKRDWSERAGVLVDL